MSDYDNTNRGAIWGNKRKYDDHGNLIGEERDPDHTGSLNVEGVDYWVDAWKRKPDAGPKAPALSFRVKRKDAPKSEAPKQAAPDDFGDTRIPF